MLPNLALLDRPLVAKPSTSIETLGDAIEFLSALSSEVRSKPHWYPAIHSVGIAIREPRYVTLATLNLQTALVIDYLLECNPLSTQG
jgi:hypothetical protein